MPRFYFHVRDGRGFLADEEGQELADYGHAERVALAGARSLLAAEALDGEMDLRGFIEVADETGARIARIAFADAIEFRRGGLPDGDNSIEDASRAG